MQGVLARLQSQAQVMVDGRSFLTSGLNISSSDGRLSLLLSVSPPTSSQTQPRLATTVSAQLKGRSGFCKVLHVQTLISPLYLHSRFTFCLSATLQIGSSLF